MDSSWKNLQIRMEAAWNMHIKVKSLKVGIMTNAQTI